MTRTTIFQWIANICRRIWASLSSHQARMQADAAYRQTVLTLFEGLLAPLNGRTGQISRALVNAYGAM